VGTVPAAASNYGRATDTAQVPETKNTTGEPENRREESEGDVSLPLLAGALLSDITPVEDRAAIQRADKVNHEAESNNPCSEEKEVNWPVDETASEGEEPEEGKKNGDGSNDFGVDEAGLGKVAIALILDGMEILSGEAGHHSCKSELADTQAEVEEIIYEMHLERDFFRGVWTCASVCQK